MTDYVQYHNSEKMGFSCLEFSPDDGFGIVTNRPVSQNLIGNRVWLIGGIGSPRKYYLCYNFVVSGIIERDNDFRFEVYGDAGQFFQPPIFLNDLPWFKDFLKSQASFSLGLQRINEKFVHDLENVAAQNHPALASAVENTLNKGGGFGNAEANRQVEQSAVQAVIKYYQERDWKVESVESQKCGYDLVCTKGTYQEHVEVKGVQGDTISFIITSGEVKQAQSDTNFVLYVVTMAVENPVLHRFTAKEFSEKFLLEPISYRAIQKTI